MNIVVLHYHRIGGSGVVAYEIGRAMAEDQKHTVHFMGLEPPFRLDEEYSDRMFFHKVWMKDYPVFDHQPYSLALASQLSELIDEKKIDVIHSHYAIPHAISAILAKDMSKHPVRCVTTLHGTDITVVGSHPSLRNITRYAILNSDTVTAVSDSLKADTVRKLDIPAEKIQTVHNFVSSDRFYPKSGKTGLCDRHEGNCVLLHISNLREVKNPLLVIELFHGIQKAIPHLELWIVGEGPYYHDMVERSRELKITDKVKFLGIRSNVTPVMQTAKLLLLPSKTESFGLVALESMACGVPALASRAGGLPEVIEDGKSGLLFDPTNLQEGIDKAIALLQDEDKYQEMVKSATERAGTQFSKDRIIKQYEEIYRKDL